MIERRDFVEALERQPSLPSGEGERFSGYGIRAVE
jgi:hypothetical protein